MRRSYNPNIHEEASQKLPRRTVAVAAAAALFATGNGAAAWAAGRDPTPSAGSTPSLPLPQSEHLPPNWPITRGLPPKACQFGDPIDRQLPQKIDSHVAAVIDSRCEPPRGQPFTNAHTEPNRQSAIIAQVFDGQTVKLDCQIAGEPLGDERSADFRNPQWFIISFPDMNEHNKTRHGYVAGANMGQLVVGAEVPPCTSSPPATPPTTLPAPSPSPSKTESPFTTTVPSPTTSLSPTTVPSPTTTPSRTLVPVPTTTPSPVTIPPPAN